MLGPFLISPPLPGMIWSISPLPTPASVNMPLLLLASEWTLSFAIVHNCPLLAESRVAPLGPIVKDWPPEMLPLPM